ncbi:DUF4382 domain-containing protein [Winogradskyella sp. PG-2]|uniref:DUF4382 domain-containing protein n=1 Tax=Winogradskyella sp. PG-2 TaxID=754409 RepID=UPI00045881A8|nr:DUF4382 domain-containing protein [Winogradskyella sp. PG-2]BAO75359.1 hypothetical protein WPG_1129 [Winogradskyella sp. PG-2]
MNHLQPIKSLFFTLLILVAFTSCTKDDISEGSNFTSITVKLKSITEEHNKVYLDIEDVQLRISESPSNGWVSLNAINSGTHNVCDLRSDAELMLADNFEIASTFIYEIRLVLGDNNFIDLNNTLHSLDVTSLGNATPSNIVTTELIKHRFYNVTIEIDIDNSVSYNEDENMMILNPKLYTEIRQVQY